MKFIWNCLQITVKTQQPWLNLFIIVQTKDCNEYAILTNLFGASTESSIPKNKNNKNKNKLHANSTWFFSLAKQTLYNTEIQILLFVSRFFFCSLLNLLTNSLAAELAYPLNGNIWRINICAQLTSIWQITSFCTVLFMFQLDVIFFCYSWLASVRCVRRPIIYYVWLENRGEKHLRQRYSNTFLAYPKKCFRAHRYSV